ncbi:MAG TPA: 2OG-Fe(II) oxygenase [Rhizomicrobium sp.]|nr:2OG-Fe(II) oxygenase [Rhizomicrobium sp.]
MSEAAVLPDMAGAQPVEELRRAAEHDPAAATQLAKRLLVGRDAPFAPEEGVSLLQQAMSREEPDAICIMATLKGGGAWTQQSWPEALDLLERAAVLGSADARAQLCIIAGDRALVAKARADEAGTEVWRALKASVDLKAFVTPKPPVQVCEAPRVWLAQGFATPELCAWLVSRSHGKLKPALMRNATTGVAHALDSRTCSDFVIDIVEGGMVMLLLRIRISAVTSIPVPHMEPPQIFHYALGQEIKAHFDFLFDGHNSYGRDGQYTGDRLATFLMYLNEGYEGGDLEFPSGKYSYKGKTGDGIFFASQRDGKPDRLSLHAAKPITRGEKYILSQWIHNQPFGG